MIPQTRVWSPKYVKNSHESTPERQTTQLKNRQRKITGDIEIKNNVRIARGEWGEDTGERGLQELL